MCLGRSNVKEESRTVLPHVEGGSVGQGPDWLTTGDLGLVSQLCSVVATATHIQQFTPSPGPQLVVCTVRVLDWMMIK